MKRKILCMGLMLVMMAVISLPVRSYSGTIRVDIGGAGEVTLYRVGILDRDFYRLSDEHGGGTLTFDDVLMPELAEWLAARATGGIARKTEGGIAEFTGLSDGLYLAVQTEERLGYEDFQPFLISLPWDGEVWYLDVKPEMYLLPPDTPQTGDRSFVVLSSWVMAASMLGLLVVGSRKKY